MTKFVDAPRFRTMLLDAMSEQFASEVPLYGENYEIIESHNRELAENDPSRLDELGLTMGRLTEERHGAIRLGSPKELKFMKEVFGVMGMHPVNYYDLTVAGHPIHSTAFRPVDPEGLAKNPFRVFTSMLRTELLPDEIREEAEKVLEERDIFSPKLRELVETNKRQGGLTEEQASEFVNEYLKTVTWQEEANVDKGFYDKLHEFSPIAADIVSFKTSHINHLTPVSLDISEVYDRMNDAGMKTIKSIQGPPERKAPILLRQVSIKAVEEPVKFKDQDGSHTARFLEVEQRGASITPEAREIYDRLLFEVIERTKDIKDETEFRKQYPEVLKEIFKELPDDFDMLRKEGLTYNTYEVTELGKKASEADKKGLDMEGLIDKGFVKAIPIIYEDFLPVSAARIFDSNLKEKGQKKPLINFDSMEEYRVYEKKMKDQFEKDLGGKVLDSNKIYAAQQARSLKVAYKETGIQLDKAKSLELERTILEDPVLQLGPGGKAA